MSTNYSHILSPLRVQKHFLKNRIMLTKCVSGELQGAEHAPGGEHCALDHGYGKERSHPGD